MLKRVATVLILSMVLSFVFTNNLLAEQSSKDLPGVVNINTATLQQLMLLPGIGEKKAKLIIASRQKHPFTRIEQLTRIKGIGKKTIKWLRPYVVFEGETTLKTPIRIKRNRAIAK